MTIQDALTTAVAGGYHVQGSDGVVTVYSGANSDFTLWTRTDNASSFIPTVSETIASLPGFGMAPVGHVSYSAGTTMHARRTQLGSVRGRIDPIPPKG